MQGYDNKSINKMKKIIKDSIHVRRLTRYQLIRKIINEKYLKYDMPFKKILHEKINERNNTNN